MTAIVEVAGLTKHFPIKSGVFSRVVDHVKAVDGVDLAIDRGETFGLVGESGCGKTTVGRCILRLTHPTSGSIRFEGTEIATLPEKEIRGMRRKFQIVFQDPFSSLNPTMTIRSMLAEPLRVHGLARGGEVERRIVELLNTVGLNPEHMDRFPHEFSGGQRQRLCIARALALNPSFIVLDEPTSALDVSVQAQVLNLLKDLQAHRGLTYLFISHNLSVIKHISHRVGVMYLGRLVEVARTEDLFAHPRHPYTEALLAAIPVADPRVHRKEIILRGDVPSPVNPPSGCHFHTRCRYARPDCSKEVPKLEAMGPAHFAACRYSREIFPEPVLDVSAVNVCPTCGVEPTYIKEYDRHYCYSCARYV